MLLYCIVLYFKIKVNKEITTQKLRSSAEGILDFYLSIFSTDDDFVLTRVRHFCFRTTLQGEIQYSFDRQAVLDKSKKTLGILSNHMHFDIKSWSLIWL